jgi:hypothetical protein
MWEPRRLTTLWASKARYRESFTFKMYIIIKLHFLERGMFCSYYCGSAVLLWMKCPEGSKDTTDENQCSDACFTLKFWILKTECKQNCWIIRAADNNYLRNKFRSEQNRMYLLRWQYFPITLDKFISVVSNTKKGKAIPLTDRRRWGCQPYAPAALYPQEVSWYSFLLEAESTPGP